MPMNRLPTLASLPPLHEVRSQVSSGLKLGARRLRDAVESAVGKREGAARVADGFRRAGGAAAAADEIERLVPRVPRERARASAPAT